VLVVKESNLIGKTSIAVAVCASGRALDFATTWVGVHSHRAAEAKPVAAALIHLGGTTFGLIAWEFLITTPAVFLACHLVKRIQARRQSQPQLLTMNCALLYSLGTISILAALHNLQFLL
jgi:uncharacterized membrane protein